MGINSFSFLKAILEYTYGFVSIPQISVERVWAHALCQASGVGFE